MSLGRKGHGALIGLLVGIIFAATAATHDQARGHRTESSQPPGLESLRLPGQTVTILPDGRWLLLGGEVNGRAVATGTLWDPNSQTATQLPGALHSGRAWHTATVLPDGTVLIIGGRDGQ
ncbi:MAG TPA: hypothetical protein VNN07_04410, partial [Candidatus Tectomicrobia bacterium]|nr:hypothetical protein [Candidatus Tectomicrobia bacterium]